MNAFFDILFDALKKYAAEIIAALLFSFSLWKFPKLRTWLTRYKDTQIPLNEEPQKQEEAPRNIEAVSSSPPYYERALKCERRAEQLLRISELFSKLHSFIASPLKLLSSAFSPWTFLIIIFTLTAILNFLNPLYLWI